MFDPGPFRTLLLPLSWPYQLAVVLRNRHYDRNPAISRRAGVPVISIGNITVGGTGKTPLVVQVVRGLRELGRRPAILTRGYGRRAGGQADEVLVFRDELGPEQAVVVNPDRHAGALEAVSAHGADCLVLDDGMQHRRLHRDLELVLVDALDPWGGGHLLPAGRLREPLAELKRADVFIITRANQVPPEALHGLIEQLKQHADREVWCADIEARGLRQVAGGTLALEDLAYRAIQPVSGLGNPVTFERLAGQVAGHTLKPLRYPDHHPYGSSDADDIVSRAGDAGADLVLTTLKDWVKLAPLWPAEGLPLAALEVELAIRRRDETLVRRLVDLLAGG